MFDKIYPKDRNQTADLLKGFAVLMMIQVHLMELFAQKEVAQSLVGRISLFQGGPPAAPLFMAVMGYFLAQSKKSFLHNIKRGLLLILGGILLNVGLNLHLLVLIYLDKIQLNPLNYILGADILPLAGLSIILIALIKKVTKDNFLFSTIFSLIILIFILIFHDATIDHQANGSALLYVQAFLWGRLEWSYFPFLPWAAYPLIGFLYKKINENLKIEQSTKDFFVLFSAVVTFVSIKYGIEVSSNLNEYYHHDWLYTLWIFQFLILMIYCFEKIETLCGKNNIMLYIKWLGKNVTAAYVIQWIIIGNITTAIFKTQNELELLVWFFLVTAATSILILMYEKWLSSGNLSHT